MTGSGEFSEATRRRAQQSEAAYQPLFQAQPLLALHARLAFESLDRLGEGGMGQVLRVRDRRFDREAALKLLKGEDERQRARFLREARIMARLDHPNIPPLYESGLTPDGTLYLLMRLIRGRTLADILKEARGSAQLARRRRELIGILLKVCEAVAYAHSVGVVHRDIKPSNIMVGAFGEVLLMDWGIARLESESDDADAAFRAQVVSASEAPSGADGLTQQGAMLGTPGYAAPEQLSGEPTDARADVFALGALLTEIVTGEEAVDGDSVFERIARSHEPRTPREVDPAAPAGLDWIAARSLAAEPAARTPSAASFAAQLRAWLEGEPIPGRPEGLGERLARSLRRRAGLVAGCAAAGLLLAALSLAWASAERGLREREQRASLESRAAERALLALARLTEAREAARRGAPARQVQAAISEALALGERGPDLVLAAAGILADLGEDEAAVALLRELAERDGPQREQALYLWHKVEIGEDEESFLWTEPMRRLVALAGEGERPSEFGLYARALEAWRAGERAPIIPLLTRAEELNPRFAPIYGRRGAAYEDLGDEAAALTDYERALAIDPKYLWILNRRGLMRARQGDARGALRDYARAIESSPGYAMSYVNRGQLRAEQGELASARQDLELAVELGPKMVDSWYNLGVLDLREGRFDAALAAFNEALALDPEDGWSLVNRGLTRARLGDQAGARADLDEAVRVEPEFSEAWLQRGTWRFFQKDLKGAVADFERAHALRPQDANILATLGAARMNAGDLERGGAELDAALALDPAHIQARLNRYRLHEMQRRPAQALEDLRALDALELEPELRREVRAALARLGSDKAAKRP